MLNLGMWTYVGPKPTHSLQTQKNSNKVQNVFTAIFPLEVRIIMINFS
jgi:hypothetical protein